MSAYTQSPNLMNLSRVSNPQKPLSIERRLKSLKKVDTILSGTNNI